SYTRALDAARRSGRPALIAEALYNLGFSPIEDESTPEARYIAGRPLFEEARTLYREIGDDAGVARTTWALALAYGADGNIDAAAEAAMESAASNRRLGDPFGLGWSLHLVAGINVVRRRLDEAERDLREALGLFTDNGDVSGIVLLVGDFAMLARARGDDDRMWRIVGAIERARRETGLDVLNDPMESVEFQFPDVPPTDPAALAAFNAGLTWTIDDAVAFVLADPAEA
ncbi:MAG TPA: hypothetical protein VFR14_03720, partial [Candidatus Limnocylindrales bacterium]|nr:hypothetical protein [Candidatus Limnocylindrales bacterium]